MAWGYKQQQGPAAQPAGSRQTHPASPWCPWSSFGLQLLKGKGTASKAAKPAAKPAVKKAAPARKSSGTERSGGAGYRQYDGEHVLHYSLAALLAPQSACRPRSSRAPSYLGR